MAGSSSDTVVRLGLVGTGPEMVEAIEALRKVSTVEIAVIADSSDRSEGAKLAKSLKLPLEKNWMAVFRTDANLILEVNGDDRQYERLLSIKPPGVEVMSIRGARLLIQLLKQLGEGGQGAAEPSATGQPAKPEVPSWIESLVGAHQAALSKSGKPDEAGMALLPVLAGAGGMEFAAIALPLETGFTWSALPGASQSLTALPTDQLAQALKQADPIWLMRPTKGLGVAGLLALRVGKESVGVLAVGRSQAISADPGELAALRMGAEFLASTLRITQPAVAPAEVVKEVVREIPVEVIKEVEVVKEIVKEVVKEVPAEAGRGVMSESEELARLRRRVEELQATRADAVGAEVTQIPLDEKMHALRNMASGVGQLFNNVLAGILGRTQLLLLKAQREKAKDLTTSLAEIEHATRVGIQALARIQEFSRERPSESFGRIDLNDVVQQAIEQTRPKWRDEPAAKGIRIELITHLGSHAPILGVGEELREAVVQVITNAVQAMPLGGSITVRTGIEGGSGFISVSDTGVGMSESVRRRAFEPFFSAREEMSLGLGLSIVYGIVARHGGEATIESESRKGTTVTLRIPVASETGLTQGDVGDQDRELLVVDDDETVRTVLVELLRDAGYRVRVAASGLEGIARIREQATAFDLAAIDLSLPDIPGWDVVEAVKKAETTTPVILMCGFDWARATSRAKELGVDFVIPKPFDLPDFLNSVRGLLAGRRRP